MPRGRPTKLTDEVSGRICEHVENGATLHIAAQAEGVNPSTLRSWLHQGRDGTEPFLSFLNATERARARFETETLKTLGELETNATLDPKIAGAMVKALTWLLERLRRERYGTQITVKVAEAKETLLDTVEAVCGRLGQAAVLVEILEELERGGPPSVGEAEEEGRPSGD